MKSNRFFGIALWSLVFAAVHGIVFLVSREYTATVWITYGFTLFAFISQLVLWLFLWRKPLDSKQTFLRTPVLTYSLLYLAVQTVLCLLFAFFSASAKTAVLVNLFSLLLFGALLILSEIGKNHIARVDHRQKDKHTEL